MKVSSADLFMKVRERKPLVHQITNFVTVNDCANATLAIGGSPVMTSSPREVADMVKLANALVLNFGTIDDKALEAMEIAGKTANALDIPVILDPVGVGATSYRTEQVKELLSKVTFQIIRGNASEILSLMGGDTVTRGVDSEELAISNAELAARAANELNSIIVVSGAKDAVSDGKHTSIIDNGNLLLTNVTGTGCMSTALIGTFSGVTDDFYSAAIAGISTMSISGELAASTLQKDEGTGTFRVRLIDAISRMDKKIWMHEVKLSEEVPN
ncbi:hydroxyethylthiazole kinase [Peribacillus frigoritolerans]|uniref:hydroxyethylthiazole kinase n=1 Tax=Peribacillus frigoritolerans TaxID=450367 RepID=UPI00201BE399|nr:hydroxyethylthiazole kinase [Peribacillus frigoritolerans]MCK2001609.1 hydroxyethylthiazole kinase [Peribacillus frigoritolerans]MEE3951235.1 hydroxyethylthiazole kinase [Peribacillus frigoritolerans]